MCYIDYCLPLNLLQFSHVVFQIELADEILPVVLECVAWRRLQLQPHASQLYHESRRVVILGHLHVRYIRMRHVQGKDLVFRHRQGM